MLLTRPLRPSSHDRTCERSGESVYSLTDCLVAAVAIRVGAPVLAHDRDFVLLARHTDLELA